MKAILSIRGIVTVATTVGIFACAATLPPQDLVDARTAYDRASTGQAQKLNPVDMHEAKKQLDVAENSFMNDGDTQNTRDQAYLAVRKTQLAVVVARTRAANMATEGVVDDMHANEKKTVALTAAELDRTRTALANQTAETKDAEARRAEAEKRAADANAALAKIGTVKQDARGTVITLSGGVLFQSAKSELLPAAQAKLVEVAQALIQEDPLSKIVIEGHTDSQGSADYNLQLSNRRAATVRDYLVTSGVAADRITSQGFGQSRPIADNNSAEGRANNRRVEIVVQPAPR
jgi:outer membrane protein OmpA-like peptidoglycan-associated protein